MRWIRRAKRPYEVARDVQQGLQGLRDAQLPDYVIKETVLKLWQHERLPGVPEADVNLLIASFSVGDKWPAFDKIIEGLQAVIDASIPDSD